jgi:AcrR family transcriptional regulator
MGRPSTPLLSRKRVAETALQIIDTHGLDALSLERLADELGVKAPSLYYHFRDKAEILAEVARRLLLEAPIPERRANLPWIEWFVQMGLAARAAILRHRNAAPLLHQFLARDLLVGLYEDAAKFLEASGVPVEQHVLVLEGLETLTISGAIAEAASSNPNGSRSMFASIGPDVHPTLARAVAANPWSADERFAQAIRRFLTGVTEKPTARRSVVKKQTSATANTPRKRTAASSATRKGTAARGATRKDTATGKDIATGRGTAASKAAAKQRAKR